MEFAFQEPSLATIPEHVAGEKKWNCYQLFCAWQRPVVTSTLEGAAADGEEVQFSDVTKELKRCWKNQPSEHVEAYKEIAKLLPLSLEDVARIRREYGKSVSGEENSGQGCSRGEKKAMKTEKEPLRESPPESGREKGESRVKEEKRSKEERRREKEEKRRLKEEKKEKRKEREERKRLKEEKKERKAEGNPPMALDTKKECKDSEREARDSHSCVERLKEERKRKLEAERKRKEEASALARQEREKTRQEIAKAKERSMPHKVKEEMESESVKKRERAEEAESRRRLDQRQREKEWERIRRWKEEEEARIREREIRSLAEAETLRAEKEKVQQEKLEFERRFTAAQEDKKTIKEEEAKLRAQLEEERRQRRLAEERARALQRKFDLDLKALSAAFQSKCSIGGPQVGGKASKLLQNTAVKRVLRLVNQFHHTSHRPTRSHAPVFVVIDTNSLEKRLLNAWRRGHSNGQYQQKVSCGQEPLVNGVIPMAVLREVDFYNKQGVKKVGSLQRILEDQFRCFNEDKPCFLHPQGVEQVYQHSSTEARPTNEDEHILNCCLFFRSHYNGCKVWLATKDRNLRLKAQANQFRSGPLEVLLRSAGVPLHS